MPPWKAPALASIAILAATGLAAAQSAPLLPAGKAAEAPQPVMACPGLGSGFFLIPGTETCLRLGADILVEAKGDFVGKDISIETRRLSTPVPNTPVALYSATDQSHSADHYSQRNDSRVTLTAVSLVNGTPIVSYVSLRNGYTFTAADIRSRTQANTAVGVDQAWISAMGVTAGLRPSVFDFSTGVTYSGGYASSRVLNQIAYEKSFGQASVAISAEDGRSRRYQEGVWASYEGQKSPDIVLRGRYSPDWGMVHVAGALHPYGDALTGKDSIGWAANAGIEYRQDWGVLGGGKGGPFGRFQLTAAYADGALDYLGVPRFATDYVADSDGTLRNTKGASASLSYEHVLRPNLKATAGLSVYETRSNLLDFTWKTRGALAQLGIEYNPASGTYVGAELNYYWDQVRGVYFAVPGDPAKADFVTAMVYLRRTL
jgi:hypothetical protein